MKISRDMLKEVNTKKYSEEFVNKVLEDLKGLSWSDEEREYIKSFGIHFEDAREWTGNTSGLTMWDTVMEELKENPKVEII